MNTTHNAKKDSHGYIWVAHTYKHISEINRKILFLSRFSSALFYRTTDRQNAQSVAIATTTTATTKRFIFSYQDFLSLLFISIHKNKKDNEGAANSKKHTES